MSTKTVLGTTFALSLPLAAMADEPLWEAGVGVGAVTFPDYRGSEQERTYPLAFPYFIYRGDRLKVDRQGLRGVLFDSKRADVDVSFDGAVPVDSDQNGAREGMPNLDPVIEVGPSLNLFLRKESDSEIALHLPLRASVATDLRHVDHLGWLFNPHLTVNYGVDWQFEGSVGLLYASEGYHDYYYEVDPAYATSERPAYKARGGFSGTRLTLGTSRRSGNFWFGAFVRYDDLSHAVIEDSPAVRQGFALISGLSMAWNFTRSESLK
jgi:outer membrane scaffolding protein for murein synthesis (MipA/OmpV family)